MKKYKVFVVDIKTKYIKLKRLFKKILNMIKKKEISKVLKSILLRICYCIYIIINVLIHFIDFIYFIIKTLIYSALIYIAVFGYIALIPSIIIATFAFAKLVNIKEEVLIEIIKLLFDICKWPLLVLIIIFFKKYIISFLKSIVEEAKKYKINKTDDEISIADNQSNNEMSNEIGQLDTLVDELSLDDKLAICKKMNKIEIKILKYCIKESKETITVAEIKKNFLRYYNDNTKKQKIDRIITTYNSNNLIDMEDLETICLTKRGIEIAEYIKEVGFDV